MKILVSISSVPDTTSKINISSDSRCLDKSGIQFIINPYDEFSLAKAIYLQKKNQAKVTVVCVGSASIEAVIRRTLAIGADNAIRVDCDPIDSLSVAREIAQIAKEGNYNLLFFGKESIDYNGGIVPSMVASILDLPFINCCIGLELDGNQLNLVREIEGGKEFLSVNLPTVISGQRGLVEEFELKIPNMRGIMQARSKSLQVKPPQFKDNRIKINRFEKPSSRNKVKIIDSNNLVELIRLLKEISKTSF